MARPRVKSVGLKEDLGSLIDLYDEAIRDSTEPCAVKDLPVLPLDHNPFYTLEHERVTRASSPDLSYPHHFMHYPSHLEAINYQFPHPSFDSQLDLFGAQDTLKDYAKSIHTEYNLRERPISRKASYENLAGLYEIHGRPVSIMPRYDSLHLKKSRSAVGLGEARVAGASEFRSKSNLMRVGSHTMMRVEATQSNVSNQRDYKKSAKSNGKFDLIGWMKGVFLGTKNKAGETTPKKSSLGRGNKSAPLSVYNSMLRNPVVEPPTDSYHHQQFLENIRVQSGLYQQQGL
ncbi:hypothetical protein BCR33DRAFT_722529 [Rhizoclosmatium globosum]|uniref:Uncharacterized protein n=1 Tax=Rhizoclosmatium globosum TaxID=329046 RepID=A0A1Y2BK85_9FUNG|nr:hypothetical protein BCR33DRAFT_722529 [Rhizoclosmatium globosum]|eukprot:ORY35181.1 hypothetical protein BCR33DRAFT_722529 [Rhizoclosmatium globosum]